MCAIAADIGTMNLVKSEIDLVTNTPAFTLERNVFLQTSSDSDSQEALQQDKWSYIKYNDNYYITGEDAIRLKNLLTIKTNENNNNIVMTKVGELRRPMQKGILNTGEEKLSIAIIQEILKKLVGKPKKENEVLCFCAPADPVDTNMSVLFHKTILTNFFKSLGYQAECIPEALAIIFSENPKGEEKDEINGKINDVPFSGIAISCLTPGQKIITKENGLTNIEDVKAGEHVWTHKGRWKPVVVPTSRHYSGKIYKLYTSYGKEIASVTKDHKIYIIRDNEWVWVEAQELKTGDIVGTKNPCIHELNKSEGKINITERITCSKPYKIQYGLFQKGMRFLGYFLSDGCLVRHDNEINFDFSSSEIDHIEDIRNLCLEIFDRTTCNMPENNRIRCRIGHKTLAEWLRNKCYDHNKNKVFPFDITKLNKSQILGLLQGLWGGDGNHGTKYTDCIQFYNSSPNLVMNFYLGCLALGFKAKISLDDIEKESHLQDGRIIKHIKQSYTVSINGREAKILKKMLTSNINFMDKIFNDSYTCFKIANIETEDYNGTVYDINVQDDHSFSLLTGATVHNCGSGMSNIMFAWKKMPLISFSVAKGGDFIDKEAAKIAGCEVSVMTKFKEKNLNLDKVDYSDIKQSALDVYYQALIEDMLNNFCSKFSQLENQIDSPLEIVLAGGTASVPGFLNKFKQALSGMQVPFKVKNVRLAKNPLYTVANGCLIKALSVEKNQTKT